MKILTVSIAAYNAEPFIIGALNSILESKNFKSIQVIVVNDGSTDKTTEVVRKYVINYPESFILINKENGGYGSTINSAIKEASGKYFKLLDADDWFNTTDLDRLIEYLSTATADIVISDYSRFYEETSRYECVKAIEIEPNYIFPIESLSDCNINPAMTIRTEILKDSSFVITERCFYTDLEFCARAVLLSNNYVYYPVSVYCYRIGREGQSISVEGRTKHIKDHEYIVKLVAEIVLANTRFAALNENMYKMLRGHITVYYLYLKPTLHNLKCFQNYCQFINDNAADVKKYLDGDGAKVVAKPYVYYLPICAKNRLIYSLKKWKNKLIIRGRK